MSTEQWIRFGIVFTWLIVIPLFGAFIYATLYVFIVSVKSDKLDKYDIISIVYSVFCIVVIPAISWIATGLGSFIYREIVNFMTGKYLN